MVGISTLYGELLRRSVVYRYRPDQLALLQKRNLGMPLDPPRRTVETRYGPMVEEVVPTSLDPALITQAQWLECQELCLAWDAFFRFIFGLYLQDVHEQNGNSRFSLIGSGDERRKCSVSPGYSSILPFVRFDLLERPDGSFAVLDVNSSRPIGAGMTQALLNIFAERQLTDARPPDLIEPLKRTLSRCYREWCESHARTPADKPSLAIVIPDSMGSVPDFRILAKQLRKSGSFSSVLILDPDEVRLLDNQLVTGTELAPIDLVLRTIKVDLDPTLAPALSEGYPGAACIVSPFWRRWLGNKLWMALAQQEPLRSEVQRALGTHAKPFFRSLPRCGLYEGGAVTFPEGRTRIESLNRKDWVVKVAAGSSARGVIIGRSVSSSMWLSGLLAMADSRLLVQELIEPRKMAFTVPDAQGNAERGLFLTKYGLYSFDGEAAGLELMASRDSYKIHGGRGTLIVPVFIR